MKSQGLEKLQLFLNSAQIPEYENRVGFLEIIGKQYNENIISRLYAYFINDSTPELRSLFIEILQNLIFEKCGKEISLFEPVAKTEVISPKKGRIDIVICDSSEQYVIIIENKIFHYLHNNLNDYWKHKSKIIDSNKVGILLSLRHHSIHKNLKGKFISITHSEWLGNIRKRGYPNSLPEKIKFYLTDFINTIENITRTYYMNKQAEFYFQNAQKIIEAKETEIAAHSFLEGQLQIVADRLGWQLRGGESDWRNIWDKTNNLDVYLCIVYDGVLNGEFSFYLVLELCNEPNKKSKLLREHLGDDKQLMAMKHDTQGDNYYSHFGRKDYNISLNELKNFSEVVLKNIKADFAAVTLKSIDYFYGKKKGLNLSVWRNNDFWREIKY